MTRHVVTRLLPLLVMVVGFFVARNAEAQDWAGSFAPSTLASRFPAGTRFLVVGAGQESVSAATTLTDALRQADYPLVMTAESLGDVASLDDQAILARSAALPVDAILILRVFPGATPETPSVVIVAYDRAGRARGSLHAEAGSPLVSQKPLPPPSPPAAPPARAGTSDAQRAYEKQFVWFGQRHLTEIGEGATRYGKRPVRGVQREKLGWQAFYEAIERPDLAQRFTRKWRLKKVFIVSGAGMLLGLVGVGLFTAHCNDAHGEDDVTRSGLVEPACQNLAVGAGVLGAAGVGLLATGIILPKQPVSRAEARRLTEEHNARLRARLGLPSHITRTRIPTARQPGLQLMLAPSMLPGGGRLGVGLRF